MIGLGSDKNPKLEGSITASHIPKLKSWTYLNWSEILISNTLLHGFLVRGSALLHFPPGCGKAVTHSFLSNWKPRRPNASHMQVYVQGLRHVRRKEIEEEVEVDGEREREGVNHSFRANCAPADPSAASLPPTIPEKSRPIVYVRLQGLLGSYLSRWRLGKHPNHSEIVAEIFEKSARGQFVEHDDGPPAFELEPNNQPGWVCCLPSGIKWKIWVICPNWQTFIHICWHWETLKICFFAADPKRAGALWRRLLLLLSGLFQVREKLSFKREHTWKIFEECKL